ncbi:hypothetical protein [Conexibacter sp. SYSU D00693]|uniref:hypothetical protein n=1 Tax=Conexibacter sp. SYSU D00693 TaxID=2812560 RepID=UPI00196B7E56|nr:hypothetical protein [Conexibacter sp. SYSU D00693]
MTHLLAHLVLLPLALWAVLQVLDFRAASNVVAWFVAGLLLHDLLVLPAYSVLDRAAARVRVAGVAAVNHVRVPAGLTLLTGAVYLPALTSRGDGDFRYLTGVAPEGYLGRWLLFVAGLWLVSALWLALRVARA